jgi:type IV pilus assembly protein PilM
MALACGLEIGANVIKLAIVEGGPRGARVRDFDVRKLDGGKKGEGPEADVVSAVKDLLKRHRVPLGNVVTSVRAQDAVVREIVVPFTRDDQIKKTIKFQAENYFHSTSIDDLVIEYLKFAELEGSKSKLLVAGVKKAHIERKLRFLEECGIDPVAIDLDIAALYNAFHFAGTFEGKALVLIVEIEQDTLKIALVDEGKLRLARAIRIRTGSIRVDGRRGAKSDRLSGEGDSVDDSARLPVVILDDDEGFSLEDSQVTEEQREDYLGKIFLEIDRTVASVVQRRPIELICLTGASCALDAVETIFQEHFEVPCQRIDLAKPFGQKSDKMTKGEVSVSLQGATALGLALKGLGVDAAGMDFRQGEYKFRGKFDSLKKGFACALCLIFALTFVFAFHLKQRLKERKNTVAGIKHLEEQVYTVLFPDLSPQAEMQHKRESVPGRWYESLKYERDRLEQIFGGGSGGLQGGNTSALVVLREFAAAKERLGPQWGIEVTQIRVDPREGQQSLFTLYAPGEQSGIALEREFAKSKVCEGSNQNSHLDPQRNKWRFDFVVKLRKQEG